VEAVDEQGAIDLDRVIQRIREDLEEAQAQSAEASRQGRYADVQKAAKEVAQLASILEHLEGLRGEWDKVADVLAEAGLGQFAAPRRRRTGKRPRPPRGQRTREAAFRIPILQALEEMGGRGRIQQVLERVEELVRGALKEVDYELVPSGRDVRWRNTARWCRAEMVREGLLASGSPVGIWEITEKGRQYLREHGG
jgi:restriction system protein